MLKTTSQQLIDSLGFEGGRVGQPMLMSTALDQTIISGNTHNLIDVPDGYVFLCTHIVVQADAMAHLGTADGSPTGSDGKSYFGLQLRDLGDNVNGTVDFRAFTRYSGIFNDGATPDWRTAPPSNGLTWKLKYPFAVPQGWTIGQSVAPSAWGNQSAVYGVMVSASAARQMGYATHNASPTADRRMGITSAGKDTGTTTMLTGVAGQCIRILDVQIRMQPIAASSNQVTLQQGDGTKIFVAHNDNPAEHLNMQFSPTWYLKAGEDLELVIDQAYSSGVNITYEYVDEDEVPSDAWFAVVEPEYPTPSTQTIGNATVPLTTTVNEVTCYYAKPDATGSHTRTSPTKGFQHFLNGYAISIQKSATTQNAADDTEQTRFTVSTGASGGAVGASVGGVTQTNYQMAPVFVGAGHDHAAYAYVDGINIPGKPDDGSLWVDVIGFKGLFTTPSAGDNNIDGFAVSLWGRTAPSFVTNRTNKGD